MGVVASGYSGIGPVAFSDGYSSEIQTYVSGMCHAHSRSIWWRYPADFRSIHRMQVMGLTIIQLATTYAGDMVNTALSTQIMSF